MHSLLDLDQFPLDQPDSDAWFALVKRCRADLANDGMFNLHGLMRPEIADRAVADMTTPFRERAFTHERTHNIYFKDIGGLTPDHPALQTFQTSNRTLCGDQIENSPLLQLYQWPDFAHFLAATMQMPALYVMDDPLARVNVMSYDAGQTLNWHFDRSEFTTTLLLQAPERGGDFEYRTGLRSDNDPNYDGVAKLLQGNDPKTQQITLTPGTLNVFKGKNTAHRVTPVQGGTARVIAVFSYYQSPGVRFSRQERIGFYGRAD